MSEENKILLHEDNTIDLRNIRSLSGLHFYIPDYQRGYRWTPSLAIQMLDDFKEFIEKTDSTGGFYCLQPVVVKPFKKGNQVFYEVIDGQQRLTTLSLILKYLDSKIKDDYRNFQHYTFTYQTPRQNTGSADIFDLISSQALDKIEFVDYFYMNLIYQAIKGWFDDEKNEGMKGEITKLLLYRKLDENGKDIAKNVRVIWYEIGKNEPATAVDIFTRLNIGKIPLTNAELIKARFLQKSNNKDSSLYRITDNIAREWDEIEHKLQNDKFWYFLRPSKDKKVYDTRIEYIFDLMSEWNEDKEFYWTFNHFSDLISKKGSESVWKDIKQYFRELEYWFADSTLFHLIGFLIECGVSVKIMKGLTCYSQTDEDKKNEKKSIKRTKSEFLSAIKSEIKKQMKNIDVKNLKYNNDADLRKTLLLFNILTVANNENSDVRFPFDKFKDSKYKWDKEHITSQTDQEKRPKGDKRNSWVKDMLYYFTGINIGKIILENPQDDRESAYLAAVEEYLKEYDNNAKSENSEDHKVIKGFIERLIAAKKLLDKAKRDKEETTAFDKMMNSLYDDTDKYFTGDEVDDKDNIGNMALLNYDINRSYGNAYFAIKRMIIRDFDESGTFIPIATRNAFMKYYSKRVDNMMYWTQDDSDAYRDAIMSTLDEYLTIK